MPPANADDLLRELQAMKAELGDAKAKLHSIRGESKAGVIGGSGRSVDFPRTGGPSGSDAQRLADQLYKGDTGRIGELLTGLRLASSHDFDEQASGKAVLSDLNLNRAEAPAMSSAYGFNQQSWGAAKATLGTTGVTGGYVMPNNFVDSVIKPNTQQAFYEDLVTVRNGINVRGVDQPFRPSSAAIATFQPWGNTKSNLNENYNTYTANLGTLALVYDISKQYARFSAGAAEQDVMDELRRGFALAENYAIIAGNGTVNTGTGDPTYGIYTALAAVGGSTYTSSFSPVATTQAGSAGACFAKMLSALTARSRFPNAIVTDALTYWTIVGQGTDTAGFWLAPTEGPTGFTRTESGQVSFWGIPMYWDANFNANTGTTKGAIMGDFKALKFYRGMEFRIDTSDVAGTRWDQNLIGFRGEEEIGVHAMPAILTGAFQYCGSVIA